MARVPFPVQHSGPAHDPPHRFTLDTRIVTPRAALPAALTEEPEPAPTDSILIPHGPTCDKPSRAERCPSRDTVKLARLECTGEHKQK